MTPVESVIWILQIALVAGLVYKNIQLRKEASLTWEDAFDTGVTWGMIVAQDIEELGPDHYMVLEEDEGEDDPDVERTWGHYSPVYPGDIL